MCRAGANFSVTASGIDCKIWWTINFQDDGTDLWSLTGFKNGNWSVRVPNEVRFTIASWKFALNPGDPSWLSQNPKQYSIITSPVKAVKTSMRFRTSALSLAARTLLHKSSTLSFKKGSSLAMLRLENIGFNTARRVACRSCSGVVNNIASLPNLWAANLYLSYRVWRE